MGNFSRLWEPGTLNFLSHFKYCLHLLKYLFTTLVLSSTTHYPIHPGGLLYLFKIVLTSEMGAVIIFISTGFSF